MVFYITAIEKPKAGIVLITTMALEYILRSGMIISPAFGIQALFGNIFLLMVILISVILIGIVLKL